MYTRSYQRDKKPVEKIEKEEILNPQEELNEAVPAGYCGTAILRENPEKPQEIFGEHGLPRQPLRRVKHLKISKKDEDCDTLSSPCGNNGCEASDRYDNEKSAGCYENAGYRDNSECYNNNGHCDNSEHRDCRKSSSHHKEDICCENIDHCGNGDYYEGLNPSRCACKDGSRLKRLRDRSFSVEDLLLGGLILLMLNEGVDDDIILIFGFLLLSGL